MTTISIRILPHGTARLYRESGNYWIDEDCHWKTKTPYCWAGKTLEQAKSYFAFVLTRTYFQVPAKKY